ncbi:MAG: MBL fold metallo-hydrolase [Anaerolineales bacterium]|jgi:L-ascorbate metabolism protein UlaG (beta-lactamase superfamily)
MQLKWFGQSCFLLTSQAGTRVLMDPFGKGLGYPVPDVQADIVTTSHNHFDHNNVAAVKGNFDHIDTRGSYTHKDIGISGTLTCHDKVQGARRGSNVVFTFLVDGLRVCHCGDLGHVLTPEQVDGIGKVDILLVPVGGNFTINAAEALEVRGQLNPAITIPMHYRTRALGLMGLMFAPVDKFLALAEVPARELRELSLDQASLGDNAGIIVMKYKQ